MMFLYTTLEALLGVAVGLWFAIYTKKQDGILYGKLDKAGRITNLVLLLVYVCTAPFYMLIGMISRPHYDGFLSVLGWIVSIIAASAALFCGLGLGASVAFRKRGKSKLSFAVQFAGLAAIGLTVLIFFHFYGNLLAPLN